MTLYQTNYRIESTRLKNWDYSRPGHYFITICTKNRESYFGKILNGKMYLSETGEIVEKFWQEIPNHFPFAILDQYIIMPNHIHGIIIITKPMSRPTQTMVDSVDIGDCVETLQCNVSTKTHQSSTPKKTLKTMSTISPKTGSLATIIRSFKSISTRTINETQPSLHFQWQSRFYDHIARNNDELNRIRLYIVHNPKNWQNDRNNQ